MHSLLSSFDLFVQFPTWKGQSLQVKILTGFHSINSHGISCLSFIYHSLVGSKQVKNLKKEITNASLLFELTAKLNTQLSTFTSDKHISAIIKYKVSTFKQMFPKIETHHF